MSRIKERLKQYHDEYSKYSKYDGILVNDVMDMLEQLQDDLEQDEKQNNWIPVTERLPGDNQIVLTSKNNVFSILRYSEKSRHWKELAGNWWWSFNMVDAWMPLPEPYGGTKQ